MKGGGGGVLGLVRTDPAEDVLVFGDADLSEGALEINFLGLSLPFSRSLFRTASFSALGFSGLEDTLVAVVELVTFELFELPKLNVELPDVERDAGGWESASEYVDEA